MNADLTGKVALVTGSTYGVGRAIALEFAKSGADVAINGRNSDHSIKVISQIEKLGRRVIFEKADINKWPEVKQMADNVLKRLGGIDILAVSGGVVEGPVTPHFFREMDPEDYVGWAKSQWLNRAYCVRSVLDHMVENNGGKIVMIGTDAGRIPTPGESMIGPSGAALVMMTKVLAAEFARWNIRVNTISISLTRDSNETIEWITSTQVGSVVGKKLFERQKFPVYTEHVAKAALFFASDTADVITGQTLSINGGISFPG